jgi:hypothetical protein
MTLVIARKQEQIIYIVSDTQLTHDDHERMDFTGIIKTKIIFTNFCVAFAGRDKLADGYIKEFCTKFKKIESVQKTINSFLDYHLRSKTEVDFILAFGEPHFSLVVVKDGEPKFQDIAWIGSQPAFELYQQYFHNVIHPIPAPLGTVELRLETLPKTDNDKYRSVFIKSKKSLDAVIHDSKVENVGNFSVAVGCLEGKFEFLDYVSILTPPRIPDSTKSGSLLHFGTAEEGGFSINFMGGASEDGQQVAAIYFLPGSFGHLYLPENDGFLRPTPSIKGTPIEFKEHLKSQYNVDVYSAHLHPNDYYDRANNYYNQKLYDLAINDLNQYIDMVSDHSLKYRGFIARGVIYYWKATDFNEEESTSVEDLYNKSIEDFSNAIKNNSKCFLSYNNKGKCFLMLEKYKEAIQDFKQSIQIKKDYWIAHFNLGYAYKSINQLQKSLKYLEQAKKHIKSDKNIKNKSGVKDISKSIKEIKQKIEQDKSSTFKTKGFGS